MECFIYRYKSVAEESTWIEQLLGIFYGNMNGAVGALWFLSALFSMECLFYWISIIRNRLFLTGTVIILHVLGMLSLYSPLDYLPWGINLAFIAVPFMGLGYLSKDFVGKMKRKARWMTLSIAFLCSTLSLLLMPITGFDLSMHYFSNWYGYIPVAVFGIVTYLMISFLIGKSFILEWLGRNTIVVIALHGPVYCVALYTLSKVFYLSVENIRSDFFWCLGVTAFVFMVLFPIIMFYNKYIGTFLNKKNI